MTTSKHDSESAEPGWISASNPPSAFGQYLIDEGDRWPRVGVWNTDCNAWLYPLCNACGKDDGERPTVINWMPLPKPPEVGE